MINIAVMGYGTIGSGVVKTLDINKKTITCKTGAFCINILIIGFFSIS